MSKIATSILSYNVFFVVASIALSLGACSGKKAAAPSEADSQAYLSSALAGEHRSAKHKMRDPYRRPMKTLSFFDVKPDMTVAEIWPGGNAWYTEILAPYLRKQGTLYLADFGEGLDSDYVNKARAKLRTKLSESPDVYDNVVLSTFNPGTDNAIAPVGSLDRVLTFRNAHNWYMNGGSEKLESAMAAFYTALKPGGMLGLVDHRLPESSLDKMMEKSGYIKESVVLHAARNAGFVLVGSSDINNNVNDTANHPKGVWTLLPSLALGEESKEKYTLIGESDRMTLMFKKPN